MDPDFSRIVRVTLQNSRTAALLGVDFVPLGNGGVAEDRGGTTAAQARPVARPEPEVAPKPAQPAAAVEIKPASVTERVEAAEQAAGSVPPVLDERRRAAQAALDEIRARYEKDAPHRKFVTAHSRIVFGEGDPCARLMFIGEAPGEEEDKTGRPFVGRAGQLLDKMIVAMGLSRADVYIANVLKTRPPNNATPTLEEAALCAPYLYDQIAAISPEVIVTLGLPASRTILATDRSMGALRGRWATFKDPKGRLVPVMPTYHPAFLLRSYTAENRMKVWSDLQLAMEKLGLKPSGGEQEKIS
jgi:DNA polymerase